MGRHKCDSKFRHKTKRAGFGHIHSLRRSGAISNNCSMDVYKCSRHGAWHVGHRSRQEKYHDQMDRIFGKAQ